MRRAILAAGSVLLIAACSSPADPAPPPAPSTTSTAGTPPATTSAAPTTEPPPEPITLLFTGDMLPSDDLQAQAGRNAGGQGFDFGPMLANVAPLITAADWAICHQETPLSDDNVGLAGYPQFNAPFQLAEAERAAGYDACSTASNHTVDLGMDGIVATLGTLDRAGIRHAGSARSAAEHAQPTVYDVRGVSIGHLSYTYALNGLPSPAPWAVNLIDPGQIRADAATVTAAGAEFVVVSLHFGDEHISTPSAYQEQVVDAVLESPDVDLVVGHHAHVVQPIERRPDGRWVLFGLGNFLAQQAVYGADLTPPHRDGVIVEVSVAAAPDGTYGVVQVGYVPTFVAAPSDVIQIAPPFSRARTEAALLSRDAPLVDLTP
ncbi:MAG: CapA family protein [Geodermatophilaceae bacterium]|nr:CapA family protein [Geodermatophilaceae bacterium]